MDLVLGARGLLWTRYLFVPLMMILMWNNCLQRKHLKHGLHFAIVVVIPEGCILGLSTRSVWALSWQVPDIFRIHTPLLTVLPSLGAVGLRPKCEEF
jgi:hypothetical protein